MLYVADAVDEFVARIVVDVLHGCLGHDQRVFFEECLAFAAKALVVLERQAYKSNKCNLPNEPTPLRQNVVLARRISLGHLVGQRRVVDVEVAERLDKQVHNA